MGNSISVAMANLVTERSSGRPTMPVLQTERLVLREFQPADFHFVSLWRSDFGVLYTDVEANDFLSFCFREYLKWGIGPWAMVLRETGRVVGSCGFCHLEPDRSMGDVNYYVAPQNRAQGLASEALRAILKYGFEGLGLSLIRALCTPDSAASERVAQKAGMAFERMVLADEIAKGASSADFRLYKIDREDFEP
jgi:[ribosomal protein S5]-alanine N-acetyltransferase